MSAEHTGDDVTKVAQSKTNIPEIERLFEQKKREDKEREGKRELAKEMIGNSLLIT